MVRQKARFDMSTAQAYKDRIKKNPVLKGEFTLPSGSVFVLRRPPIQLWVASGRIPETFLQDVLMDAGKLTSDDPAEREAALAALGDDKLRELMTFMLDLICYACVEPPVYRDTDTTAPADCLRISDLDSEDYTALLAEVQAGCPCVPVALAKGGEVSVGTLKTFRQKKPGGRSVAAAESVADGADILHVAEQSAGA